MFERPFKLIGVISLLIILLIFCHSGSPLLAVQLVLPGVPVYHWQYGCAPTSGGMLLGYWDARGYDLIAGDISATDSAAALDAIASTGHVADYWGDPDPLAQNHVNDSLADFMGTSVGGGTADGSTSSANVVPGLENFAAWDDPSTGGINESYLFDAAIFWTIQAWPGFGTFNFSLFKSEIDALRPVLLGGMVPGGGHMVIGYGYDDPDNVPDSGDEKFAVHDTWYDGVLPGSPSDQLGATISGGVEWWPWKQTQIGNYWIEAGVTFLPLGAPPGVPEPAEWVMLLIITIVLAVWHKGLFIQSESSHGGIRF
ncbi:MAG: hypothetical protein CVV64_14510 [Candidatus Wallbacteria bacterium HGW-Wallbacteria-1]|uniref:Peptidase C39-like domain-containing protein n=1 Tax=Candidatus Wallbacteria bacterium HGW-Wallbacteria-1 TaxID=2013854 RepID=A0A2N1PM40_9BACT|nr:MAG: hypothetical protein CVV64_14510 [Candidatus Wallbacteria bacterium HGW-Wallbacteria-1]